MSDIVEVEEEEEPSAPFWMATFSDMATLLLAFFVMIVAMSEVEVKKFKEAMSYFQGRTGVLMHDAALPPVRQQVITSPQQKEAEEMDAREARYEMLLQYLQEHDLDDKVKVDMREDGVNVLISDSVMFRSGEAILLPRSRELLHHIASVLNDKMASVVVEGHTDNRPIHSSVYPSNWELSAARAASVVRYLIAQPGALPPAQYSAVGYGEFRPVASNESAEGRSKNRRVEILFSWKPWQTNPSSKPPEKPETTESP